MNTSIKDKNDKKYAMKVEKILKKQAKKSFKYDLWREIEFVETMNKINKNHFMKLYDHFIDNKCKHKQDWTKINLKLENFDKGTQKKLLKV